MVTGAPVTLERPDVDWTRDQWGRPVILPDPRWLENTELAPATWLAGDGTIYPDRRYTRVTTYGEALLDGSALSRWKMRRVALGMGRRPDYVTAAAALTAEERDKAALNDLAEKALEAAGPNAADIGTALHAFTERIDRGEDVGVVPPEYRADLDAYRQVVAPLTFLHREARMVCDELETAGTPDAIALCDVPDPDGETDLARIVDLKTGNVEYTAGKFSTQLAIYAHSALYGPVTGTRSYPARPLSVRWGLVVHMPAGMGTAQLRWLNLEHGWAGAQLAGPVREWRKPGARELSRPVFMPAGVTWSADGKCQGSKRDGGRCTYRAQDNGFCTRHQSQSQGDAPVVRGDAAAIPDPVLEGDALEARTEDVLATVSTERALELVGEQPSTAVDQTVDDPVLDVGDLIDSSDPSTAQQAAALGFVEQPATEPMPSMLGAWADGVQPDQGAPPELGGAAYPEPMDWPDRDPSDVPGGAAFGPMDIPADDPAQQAWLAAQAVAERMTGPELAAALAADEQRGELAEAGELDAELPVERCDLTDLPVDQCGCARHRPDLDQPEDDAPPIRELNLLTPAVLQDPRVHLPPLPYRAEDPMDPHQLQGNPRPLSRIATPWDAEQAARDAERSLLQQVAGCRSRTELELLWNATGRAWTPAVVAAAARRAEEVDRLPAAERTSAALWSAIRNADTEDMLLRLWQDAALQPLWTDAHRAAAAARQAELRRG
jgi:hypothetical protein